MNKKRAVLLGTLMVALSAALFWWKRSPPEPAYQGKSLTVWLNELESWSAETNEAAFAAFREMGPSAVPHLLDALQYRPSIIDKVAESINERQSLVELPIEEDPGRRIVAASLALYGMGTNARAAFPALTNQLFHTNALLGTIALAGLGSEAIPVLLMALTNQNEEIRNAAAHGLGWVRSDFDSAVPSLIRSLNDNSGSSTPLTAAWSLGRLHAKPELAVPALVSAFTNHSAKTQQDRTIRNIILVSLSRFEESAKPAVPMIKAAALNDTDSLVRNTAISALGRIDPEAVKEISGK